MTRRHWVVLAVAVALSLSNCEARAAESAGIQKLCGEGTPLRKEDRISFIGDSITMQGGYVDLLAKALKTGKATAELGVELFKHGLNGGRTDTIQTGVTPWGRQDSYEALLTKDKPSLVVLFLGVNDVNQGNNVGPEAFEKNLTTLVDMALKAGASVVLATLAVTGEKPNGGNPADKKLDQYARLARKVAEARKVTLCDIRAAFMDHLKANNPENKANGILTYDGIHMGPKGNELLAECMATAIVECLKARSK
jgi:lysophospholipase L1-like esterase